MNRRKALATMGKISAGMAGAGLFGNSSIQGQDAAAPRPGKIDITIAGYNYDRCAALADGRVQPKGCKTSFTKSTIGEMNRQVFSGAGKFDVTEVGLHPFMLAYDSDGLRDYVLLPVFPLRVFRHKSIFIRNDRGISKPQDLRGKKVATPGFSSSSLTWLRGILQDEYGVKPSDLTWYVSAKDSASGVSGKPSAQESVIPDGLTIRNGPEGRDESEMLADGDVDALLHAVEPKCYVEGHPKVDRLFTDFRSTEQDYFRRTGIFPIMHAVAVKRTVIRKNPWLPKSLFDAYSRSKQLTYEHLEKMAWADSSLPWVAQEVENTHALMGRNFWPYGINPNRKTLETLFRYSFEQGFLKRQINITDLFDASTLEFEEH